VDSITNDRLERFNRWNRKCPQCGAEIYFTLRNNKLGSTASAYCSRHVESTRVFTLEELREKRVKFCDWEGYAVRMWDGSVRFKERSGRWLIE